MLLLSGEIHLLLYYCVLQAPVRKHIHRDCTYGHQLVITYGISSSAWYPFRLLRFTETSIKKKSKLHHCERNMVQLTK